MYKTFNHYMNELRRTFYVCEELASSDAIKPLFMNNKFYYKTTISDKLSDNAKTVIRMPKNEADMDELFLMIQIAKNGPVIFKPTQMQFEMMEHMTVNVEARDYVQPFETIIIELPKNYVKNKIVDCPQEGQIKFGEIVKSSHQPRTVIINLTDFPEHEFKMLIAAVMFDSHLSIKSSFLMKYNKDIEHYISLDFDNYRYVNTLDVTKDEDRVNNECLRSAINYCMLLDEIGIKRIGPNNQKYYDKLNRDKIKNHKEIKLHPIIYDLNQEVKLFEVANESLDNINQEHTGRIMPPHRRRGHYKQQPHGPNNSLRKRIRILPTFVHRELFFGKMIDAKSNYQLK